MEGIQSSVSDGLNSFQQDLEDDKKTIKESEKQRLLETFNNIKENFVPKTNQSGSGKRRSSKHREPAKKRNKTHFKSVFDE